MRNPVDKELLEHLGKQIRTARMNAGLRQSELAERVGISVKHLGNVEAGRTGVSVTALNDICKVLGVDSNFLLCGEAFVENDTTFFIEQIKRVDPKYLPFLRDAMEASIRLISHFESLSKKD